MFGTHDKKGVVIREYKIVNVKGIEEQYDSLEQAENYYEDMIKKYPNMNWVLYELLICNDCDYVKEEGIKWED